MRAKLIAATGVIALALTGACARRVAPAAPGTDATDTAPSTRASSDAASDVPAAGEEQAKEALRQLFDHCAAKEYAQASGFFLYEGSDTSRIGKSALSTDDPGEAAAVEARCENLVTLIESSGGFAIVGHQRETRGEQVWHRLQVSFSTAGEPTKRVFSMLEVNGRFLLGNVE